MLRNGKNHYSHKFPPFEILDFFSIVSNKFEIYFLSVCKHKFCFWNIISNFGTKIFIYLVMCNFLGLVYIKYALFDTLRTNIYHGHEA